MGGKDRPIFDAYSDDRRLALKFFLANFRDYCIIHVEDYVNPTKELDSDDYWIVAKRPKVMAALRRAFPPAEWDVLTTTIDAQLSQHYLGEEPIIKSTHNFLRILRQEPGMSIQDWHTLVRLEYQKCNFPTAVDDRLQRDIFVIGLNETFKPFRSDIIARENLSTLTFAQVISKARDFEAGLKTESAITKHHLEEAAHKVSPATERPKTPHFSNRRFKDRPPGPSGSSACPWCGRTTHPNHRDCPASNDTCHGCGKRGHWKQVCRATPVHVVSEAEASTEANQQENFIVTHEMYQVQAATKGLYVDLNMNSTSSPGPLRFQVDSGCSCNTIHINDLKQLPPTQIKPSMVRLLDYSKSIIPTKGQVTLHCTRRGVP